jgi:UDP-N-acetylglucosamine 4-epimerase
MKILITGVAGFIGSNLLEHFLTKGFHVRGLDNFATGFKHNLAPFLEHNNFTFIEGDIRDIAVCQKACEGVDYVLHQAALGSVPRSIKDPITTNEVNNNGFLNMLVAARDQEVKRFIYAASSSTYGDSKKLPKIEEEIGKPLSPYAITKYVNELYANVFAKTYNMQCIGLRYFNVFGKRQTPDGAYAAVIPLWVKTLLEHKSPIINGDGSYSRDFTYIQNVVQANEKAMLTPTEEMIQRRKDYYNVDLDNHKYYNESAKSADENQNEYTSRSSDANQSGMEGQRIIEKTGIPFSEVFNVAYGGNTNLLDLLTFLKKELSKHDPKVAEIQPIHGKVRPGDVPHSQASIVKAQMILGYKPEYSAEEGFREACEWYAEEVSKAIKSPQNRIISDIKKL